MKIIEDYGWEAENYIVPRKIPQEPPIVQPSTTESSGESIPVETPVPANPPLPARQTGGEMANAVK